MRKRSNKNRDLNNKLQIDKISYVELVTSLKTLKNFRDSDIKYALKSMGRNFNYNSPFHSVCRKFFEALGDAVTTRIVNGEKIYTISSLNKAMENLGYKKKEKQKGVDFSVFSKSVNPVIKEAKEEIPAPVEEVKPKKKVYGGTALSYSIKLLAIYLKKNTRELTSRDMNDEIKSLNADSKNFKSYASGIEETLKEHFNLGLSRPKQGKTDGVWKITGEKDLLDAYYELCEHFKNKFGFDHEDLTDYIMSSGVVIQEPVVEKKIETTPVTKEEVIEETGNEIPFTTDQAVEEIEETPITRWKKWLLISALKYHMGASTKISILTRWVEKYRRETISESEATRLLGQIEEDIKGSIRNIYGDWSFGRKSDIMLAKYNPKKMVEKIYVKLKMDQAEVQQAFSDLDFSVDETLGNGKYIYEVQADRSYSSECCLVRLLKFIRISGTLYTTESPMINRAKKLIDLEKEERRKKDLSIRSLE